MDGIMDSMDMNLGKLREMVRNWEAWRAAAHEVTKSWTQLSDCSKQQQQGERIRLSSNECCVLQMNSRHTALIWGHIRVPALLYVKGH